MTRTTFAGNNSQHDFAESRWWLLTLVVARDAEEAAGAVLFDMGSIGTITREESPETLTLGAYFESRVHPDDVKQALEAAFGTGAAVTVVSVSSVEEQDWMQKWKEGFEASAIGNRLIVAPSWKAHDARDDRLLIQIDPGMAFGTGTHETTRLCLEGLEHHWHGGSLLDVGTGTGILAIAAALLKPDSRVVAIDVDPQAIEVARENAAINRVSNLVEFREGQPRDLRGQAFDLVIANLTAEVIVDLIGDLCECAKKGGSIIVSGILADLEVDVERAILKLGLAIIERRQLGEWCSMVANKLD